jgi:predicted nucleotidyltransferase
MNKTRRAKMKKGAILPKTRATRRRAKQEWLPENRAALQAYNEHVARHGVFSESLRSPAAALIAERAAIRRILSRHGLSNPRLFGSAARGEDTEASDLDLLVDASPRTSLLDLARARNRLADALGVAVGLVTPEDLPPRIRAVALAEAVPL